MIVERFVWMRAALRARVAALLLSITLPLTTSAQSTLSLGDAARLAAAQGTGIEAARARVQAADARATQRRGVLLPDLAAGVQQAARTTNSATFGFAFRDPLVSQLDDLAPVASGLGPHGDDLVCG